MSHIVKYPKLRSFFISALHKFRNASENDLHDFANPEISALDSNVVLPLPTGRHIYQYEPLRSDEEVRLLVLSPGAHTDEIHCDLKHYLLSGTPKFGVLSYAWGDISMSHEVLCNNKRIPVTKGAFIALNYLRRTDRARIVWIDAICINQGSDVKKSHQVSLMRDIYTKAQRTAVWLGRDNDNNAERAFEYISRIYDCLQGEHQTESEFRQRIATEYQYRRSNFEDWAIDFIEAIAPIFDQTWSVDCGSFRKLLYQTMHG